MCVLMLAYLAVPVSSFPYLYGICLSYFTQKCTIFDILFGKAQIDHVNDVTIFADTHEEIVRLDVPVEDLSLVQKLYAIDHLLSQH